MVLTMTRKQIAQALGISPQRVSQLITKEGWQATGKVRVGKTRHSAVYGCEACVAHLTQARVDAALLVGRVGELLGDIE